MDGLCHTQKFLELDSFVQGSKFDTMGVALAVMLYAQLRQQDLATCLFVADLKQDSPPKRHPDNLFFWVELC